MSETIEAVSVASVSAKRVLRKAEEKRRIVEATLVPGASIARVARDNGVNANQIFQWRHEYRKGTGWPARQPRAELLPVSDRERQMKYVIGYLIWMLMPVEVTAVHQSAVARVDVPQSASIRLSHDILAENKPLSLILFDILRGTGVHGGFVEIAGCSDWPKGHLEVKQGTTLHEAMAALVAANPSYRWDLQDNVVNLMPRDGVPLLRTKIAKFQMDATDSEIRIVLQDLLRLPEVREREAALGLKQGLDRGPGLGVADIHPVPRQPVPVHINLLNLSLLDAFNKIVQASPKAVWIYHQTECNGAKTYTVEVVSDY